MTGPKILGREMLSGSVGAVVARATTAPNWMDTMDEVSDLMEPHVSDLPEFGASFASSQVDGAIEETCSPYA